MSRDWTGRVTMPSDNGIEGPMRVIGPWPPASIDAIHEHHWQPGPFLAGWNPENSSPEVPDSILLVCSCAAVRRVEIPHGYEIEQR